MSSKSFDPFSSKVPFLLLSLFGWNDKQNIRERLEKGHDEKKTFQDKERRFVRSSFIRQRPRIYFALSSPFLLSDFFSLTDCGCESEPDSTHSKRGSFFLWAGDDDESDEEKKKRRTANAPQNADRTRGSEKTSFYT